MLFMGKVANKFRWQHQLSLRSLRNLYTSEQFHFPIFSTHPGLALLKQNLELQIIMKLQYQATLCHIPGLRSIKLHLILTTLEA